jgi:UDP-N-acetylglucosamine acyltransferase
MVAASARVNQDCLPFIITDGMPGRARGLNAVGLRRAGVSRADMDALKRAFRVLRSNRVLEVAVQELAALDSPYTAELAAFIRESKRGFAHVKRGEHGADV